MDGPLIALFMSVNFFAGVVFGAAWYKRRLVANALAFDRRCKDVADCLHVHISEHIFTGGPVNER